MTRHLALSLLVLAVALPTVATAQPPGGGRGPGGPGGGSPLEMMGHMFDMADANRDGQLTKSELAAAISQMNNQRGGFQQGRGGPPPGAGNGPGAMQRGFGAEQAPPEAHQGGPGGPPSRPGQVLPDFIAESLNLTDRQQKQLAALQSSVDKRLAGLLTDEQLQQLQNPPPPPHGEGGPPPEGGPPQEGPDAIGDNARPQRPQ